LRFNGGFPVEIPAWNNRPRFGSGSVVLLDWFI
jgi:hypothetical protein